MNVTRDDIMAVLSCLKEFNATSRNPVHFNKICNKLEMGRKKIRFILKEQYKKGIVSYKSGENGGYYLDESIVFANMNGNRFIICLENRSIQSLIKKIFKIAGDNGSIVRDIKVNGFSIFDYPNVVPFEMRNVEITVEPFHTAFVRTIRESIDVLPELINILKRYINLVRTGELKKASEEIDYCLTGVQWVLSLLQDAEQSEEFGPDYTIDKKTLREYRFIFEKMVDEIKVSVKTQNYRLGADVLEHKIVPFISSTVLMILYHLNEV